MFCILNQFKKNKKQQQQYITFSLTYTGRESLKQNWQFMLLTHL